MNKVLGCFIILFFFLPTHALAGDLQGQVTVLRKNSTKPLKSFDNTAVYIKGLETEPASDVFHLDQKGKKFLPRLSVVQTGQPIEFTNSDRVKHNVFSKDLNFDLGYMKRGEFVSKNFDALGVYKIYCNIHIGMIADLLIVENPYYALTDKKGSFLIKDIPNGDYTLAVWHIYGGQTEMPVTITENNAAIDVTIQSTQIVREIKDHLNKEGKPYSLDDDYDY